MSTILEQAKLFNLQSAFDSEITASLHKQCNDQTQDEDLDLNECPDSPVFRPSSPMQVDEAMDCSPSPVFEANPTSLFQEQQCWIEKDDEGVSRWTVNSPNSPTFQPRSPIYQPTSPNMTSESPVFGPVNALTGSPFVRTPSPFYEPVEQVFVPIKEDEASSDMVPITGNGSNMFFLHPLSPIDNEGSGYDELANVVTPPRVQARKSAFQQVKSKRVLAEEENRKRRFEEIFGSASDSESGNESTRCSKRLIFPVPFSGFTGENMQQ